MKEIRAFEKALDVASNTAAGTGPTPTHLRNPDGVHDLFITGSRPPDPRPEEVSGRRTRKPAASKEMPIPLTADAAQKKKDEQLLKMLGIGPKKRRRVDDDENEPPKKRYVA